MARIKQEPVYSPFETWRFGVSDKHPQGNVGNNYLGGAFALFWFSLFPLIIGIIAKITGAIIIGLILLVIAIALVIGAYNNWGKPTSAGKYAHRRYLEKEELRQEQLRALKRGNVGVKLKGKMSKLK